MITGASSGIGEACARRLVRHGYQVYGASRRFVDGEADGFITLRMDVSDDASVEECVGRVLAAEVGIDAVVNCAGVGLAGAVEATTLQEARALFETNFFGAVRVSKAVLPRMRERRSGLIVNMSSIGGMISIPFQAFYSASKFALEGLSEALRIEVLPFGVRVVLVEPGDVNTSFTSNRQTAGEALRGDEYDELFCRAMAIGERNEAAGIAPERIALLVENIIERPRPKLRYSIGPAFERCAPVLKHALPQRLSEWMTLKYFDLL